MCGYKQTVVYYNGSHAEKSLRIAVLLSDFLFSAKFSCMLIWWFLAQGMNRSFSFQDDSSVLTSHSNMCDFKYKTCFEFIRLFNPPLQVLETGVN